jgi:hypothetical protein
VFQGWIHKQSGNEKKPDKWQRRFLVLGKDGRAVYYKDDKKKQVKGLIDLAGAKAERVELAGHTHAFQVVYPADAARRVYKMNTEYAESSDKWVAKLNEAATPAVVGTKVSKLLHRVVARVYHFVLCGIVCHVAHALFLLIWVKLTILQVTDVPDEVLLGLQPDTPDEDQRITQVLTYWFHQVPEGDKTPLSLQVHAQVTSTLLPCPFFRNSTPLSLCSFSPASPSSRLCCLAYRKEKLGAVVICSSEQRPSSSGSCSTSSWTTAFASCSARR